MRDIPTSPRIIEIKRQRRVYYLRLFILTFVFFTLVIWALSFFSNYRRLTINEIKIEGTNIIDNALVKESINKTLSGKYLFLFAKKNGFIYPKQKIYNNLITEFPRIEELELGQIGLNTLSVKIKERSGSYLYCGAVVPEIETDIGENCYFVNNDGFIFDKAPYFSGNVYFKYYLFINTTALSPLGLQMIPQERIHEIIRFIDGVKKLGFDPAYLVIENDGSHSLYLNHKSKDSNPRIMFKADNNLETIKDNLSLSMQKNEFANEIKSKYDKLLYIDLRFNNKVLYKFQ